RQIARAGNRAFAFLAALVFVARAVQRDLEVYVPGEAFPAGPFGGSSNVGEVNIVLPVVSAAKSGQHNVHGRLRIVDRVAEYLAQERLDLPGITGRAEC